MTKPHEPFLAWPGWPLLRCTARLALAVSLWWALVYCGADWLTGFRPRVPVHLQAELALPFIPSFILVYVSLNPVFALAPFILRSRRQLQALALSLVGVTAVAGVGFLLLPAEPAYPPHDAGTWSGIFAASSKLTLRFNMVPSLHVAMSSVCLAAYATRCRRPGKLLLFAWAAAISLSTLLTHQHHLLDVATGLLLAAAGKRLVYDRWLSRQPAAPVAPHSSSADPVPSA